MPRWRPARPARPALRSRWVPYALHPVACVGRMGCTRVDAQKTTSEHWRRRSSPSSPRRDTAIARPSPANLGLLYVFPARPSRAFGRPVAAPAQELPSPSTSRHIHTVAPLCAAHDMAAPDTKTARPPAAHVADPALAPFLQPRFDPADFLNATLPALSTSSRPAKSGAASLAELSTQTQDLLSQLNAHTTRLSSILTQLTDDILRSGGRLAYEVEVLRGETVGLAETLTDGLKSDIHKFVPGGINVDANASAKPHLSPSTAPDHGAAAEQAQPPALPEADDATPEYISDLRTLATVRSRLEKVIKVFGEAMHWTIPPSEVSLGASLISVSAPENGTDGASREQKGKEFAASLRSEIADLITGDPDNGVDLANTRIQALRDLAKVWKGTAEEKARIKFIEGLIKLTEDKQRELEREREKERSRDKAQQRPGRSGSVQKPPQPPQPQRTGGFLENLQRIRGFVESEFE
ncbi:hypothetical protein T440DRAFT_468890 [Plenodomus tracheiphilus IPT5]|uniref:Uncharacterized protein n=1 Tax=Plenodomus tracheiphilus IPT5 TaxID=1408161 RepID=A0A6A7B355_9PLEO|nr:hypothetical protein T440DRAFT_468890 [Plenodomus tracheiphilus IPT5]